MSSIGKRVMARRLELGLTQLQLEQLTGIRQATLSRLEKGVHSNSIHLPTLAIALQCTAEYLAFGNRDEQEPQDQYDRLLYAANALKDWSNASMLAEMLTRNGYSVIPQGISNWKKRGLSYEAILKCSRIIGCDPTWLETGEGTPSGDPDRQVSEAEQIAASLSEEQLTAWLEIGRLMNRRPT